MQRQDLRPLFADGGHAPEEARITLRGGDAPDGGVAWDVSGSFPAEFPLGTQRLVIAANIIYVEQAVRALGLGPDEKLEFCANEPLKSFLVKPAGDDDCWVLTMPMQPV